MAEEKELPTFPDILPSSIKESRFYQFEEGDTQTDGELRDLIILMYNYPERDFYYFRRREGPSHGPLDSALHAGLILEEEAELFWYKQPELARSFVRVHVRDGNYEWDWQKEAVQKSPMFVRIKLRLSERTRRELEIKQKIEAEKEVESNPLEFKPGVAGFSIDLVKTYDWVRRWWQQKQLPRG